MKASELADIAIRYPEFDVKMRFVKDSETNEFIDAEVLKLYKVKYTDKEIIFYIDR